MRSIHKHSIDWGESWIPMQPDTKFLHFEIQGPDPVIWVDEGDEFPLDRKFYFLILPTGAQIPEDHFYLGTAMHGPFVWHLYTTNRGLRRE